MTGVSEGAKTFSLQLIGGDSQGFITGGANQAPQWNYDLQVSNNIVWNQTRLDLRAYNQGGKGLDLRTLALQESLSWSAATTEVDYPPYVHCVDVISSVPLTLNSIAAMNPDIGAGGGNYHFLPGFLASASEFNEAEDQTLNSTQVVWGLWRRFALNQMFPYDMVLRLAPLTTLDSGEFGSGEMLVAPFAYWTRVVWVYSDDTQVFAPTAKIECGALTVDLKPLVEMNQMARMSQR